MSRTLNLNNIKQKACQILELLPTTEVERMDDFVWSSLYESEVLNRVSDNRIIGIAQPHITRIQRYHIVTWMSEACAVLGWTAQTFFVAVHALDAYVTSASHEILASEFGSLATACLYFGAQLMESATDENVYTLEKFQTLCPEVGHRDVVREAQVHLLDTLQGCSLCRKTPQDFFGLYMAEFKLTDDPHLNELFRRITETDFIAELFDLCAAMSLVAFTSGLCFDLRCSEIVMCGILHALRKFDKKLDRTNLIHLICKKVFHYKETPNVIQALYQLTSQMASSCFNVVYIPPVGRKGYGTNSEDGHDLVPSNPLCWIKHMHPEEFCTLAFASYSEKTIRLSCDIQRWKQNRSSICNEAQWPPSVRCRHQS